MFQGAFVALVTPFRDGEIDETALCNLIEWHIEQGIDGFVPVGTTGESATLSHEEHNRVIDIVVACVNKRLPVIAGTGSNSTREAIALTAHAKEAGCDGALLISPYYNKPTQQGLIEHFRAIADEVALPLIVYNIPGRTAVTVNVETLIELSKHANIVAVKDATGSTDFASQVTAACGDALTVLSGDDLMTLPMMAVGGRGVITASGNVIPAEMAQLVDAMIEGDLLKARMIHHKMTPLTKALFCETNPIPTKKALELMGLIDGEIRLPLTPMSEAGTERLRSAMTDYGLI